MNISWDYLYSSCKFRINFWQSTAHEIKIIDWEADLKIMQLYWKLKKVIEILPRIIKINFRLLKRHITQLAEKECFYEAMKQVKSIETCYKIILRLEFRLAELTLLSVLFRIVLHKFINSRKVKLFISF